MTKDQVIYYLKDQAQWIERLIGDINEGKTVTCDWAIDIIGLDELLKEVQS